MAKYLNVDEMGAEKRILKVKGVEYQMRELTVEDFIETVREIEKAQTKGKKKTLSEQIEGMVDSVLRAFPDCPRKDLVGLGLPMLTKIIEFITTPDTVKAEGQSEGGEGKKQEG